MSDTTEQVTLYEAIQAAIDSRHIDLHVGMPCLVEAYHADKQTVDVLPQLNRALPDFQGNYIYETLPKLADVPVVFPSGGGFMCTFPLQKGDFVMVVFSERSIGAWRSIGSQGDPGDLGMHTLDGAVAFPCVNPDGKLFSDASDSNMVMGKDGSDAQVVITDTEVHVAGDDYNMPKWNDFMSDMQAFMTDCVGAVPIVVGSTGVPTGTFKTDAQTILTKIIGGTYNSSKAKNG